MGKIRGIWGILNPLNSLLKFPYSLKTSGGTGDNLINLKKGLHKRDIWGREYKRWGPLLGGKRGARDPTLLWATPFTNM